MMQKFSKFYKSLHHRIEIIEWQWFWINMRIKKALIFKNFSIELVKIMQTLSYLKVRLKYYNQENYMWGFFIPWKIDDLFWFNQKLQNLDKQEQSKIINLLEKDKNSIEIPHDEENNKFDSELELSLSKSKCNAFLKYYNI